MTLQEFLLYLENTSRQWRLEENHALTGTRHLLRGEDHACPLQAVFCSAPSTYYFPLALEAGLSEYTTRLIVKAADNEGAPQLRARLLKACGLS